MKAEPRISSPPSRSPIAPRSAPPGFPPARFILSPPDDRQNATGPRARIRNWWEPSLPLPPGTGRRCGSSPRRCRPTTEPPQTTTTTTIAAPLPASHPPHAGAEGRGNRPLPAGRAGVGDLPDLWHQQAAGVRTKPELPASSAVRSRAVQGTRTGVASWTHCGEARAPRLARLASTHAGQSVRALPAAAPPARGLAGA